MGLKFWKPGRLAGRPAAPRLAWPKAFRPRLEALLDRVVPAVTFTFDAGQLTIFGD